jgi:hypothetical protein
VKNLASGGFAAIEPSASEGRDVLPEAATGLPEPATFEKAASFAGSSTHGPEIRWSSPKTSLNPPAAGMQIDGRKKDGAGNGIRTRDPQLGRLTL